MKTEIDKHTHKNRETGIVVHVGIEAKECERKQSDSKKNNQSSSVKANKKLKKIKNEI